MPREPQSDSADSRVGERLRAIAALQVARDSGADECWALAADVATRLGFDDEQVDAIRRGDEYSDQLSAVEQAVAAFTHELLHMPRPCADTAREITAHLTQTGMVELVSLIGEEWTRARMETALTAPIKARDMQHRSFEEA